MPLRASSIASHLVFRLTALLALALAPGVCIARSAGPIARISLDSLDFQNLPPQVLASGASVVTLHYADAHHLLLTFNRRRLMPRIPGDPETDVDRNIDALLLEIPSGKVLARTAWRVHDPGQYLWCLGEDAFLLRQRDSLTVFRPVAGLASGEVFVQQPFIKSNRSIGSVLISPDRDLLTLETLNRSPYLPRERKPSPGTMAYAAAAATAAGDQEAEAADNLVQIDFFRLHRHPSTGVPFPSKAGTVGARNMVLLPVDAAGYLSVVDQGKAHWAFDFHQHTGKVDELSPFDSTCHPVPFLVSRSEFIAFGCRGGHDTRQIGGFNLRGEEMWEQVLPESFTSLALSFAPSAGRFALSRMITSAPVVDDQAFPEQFLAQTITVFQTETGRQIFSLNANPMLRASQNFTLSPGGQELAVLNNGAIEIYALPAPNPKELAGIHLAESLAPHLSEEPIRLGASATPKTLERDTEVKHEPAKASPGTATANDAPMSGEVPAVARAPVQEVDQPASIPSATTTQSLAPPAETMGDAPAETGHRKPPTLYNPGEKPEADPARSK